MHASLLTDLSCPILYIFCYIFSFIWWTDSLQSVSQPRESMCMKTFKILLILAQRLVDINIGWLDKCRKFVYCMCTLPRFGSDNRYEPAVFSISLLTDSVEWSPASCVVINQQQFQQGSGWHHFKLLVASYDCQMWGRKRSSCVWLFPLNNRNIQLVK